MKKILVYILIAVGTVVVSSCEKTKSSTDFRHYNDTINNQKDIDLISQYYDAAFDTVANAKDLKSMTDGLKAIDKYYEDSLLKKNDKEIKKFRKDCAADSAKCRELATNAAKKKAEFDKKEGSKKEE